MCCCCSISDSLKCLKNNLCCCLNRISTTYIVVTKEVLFALYLYYKKVNNDGTILTPCLSILGIWTSVITATFWLFWEDEHNEDKCMIYLRQEHVWYGTVAGFLVSVKLTVALIKDLIE